MRRLTARPADYRLIAALRPDTLPAPLSAAELTGRIDRLRQQLLIANGEWADRIEGDIAALERMLAK